jgi:paraquat-inducible protein B
MSEPQNPPSPQWGAPPQASVKRRWAGNWIWIIPLVALIVVGYLGYSYVAMRGPLVSVRFETAEGLSPKQTEVKYKAVTIGRVEAVELSDDRSHVIAKVRMDARAEPMLTEKARFWVVRPRLGGGLQAIQAGLQTLVSGAYVAIDPGDPAKDAPKQTEFDGLEAPPSMHSNEPGSVYYLTAAELGGVSTGSPIRYRDKDVGEVLSHHVEPKSDRITLRIFIEAPYDDRVVDETRFWDASGIEVGSDGDGLSIEILSARALLQGGIAFDTPNEHLDSTPSEPESTFRLYQSEAEARLGFYPQIPYVSYFQSSVRGLSVGSEVHMYGRRVGAVTGIELTRDPREGHDDEFAVRVAYAIQPERALPEPERPALEHDRIEDLVSKNLRVALESSNLLTGEKALSLVFGAGESETVTLRTEGEAVVLPSETQDIAGLTTTLAAIANDVERIPFAEIGRNLNETIKGLERTVSGPELQRALVSLTRTLDEAHQLVREARAGIGPALDSLPRISKKLESAATQAERTLGRQGYGASSPIHRNLERMIDNVAEAARSVRVLADHLDRHPESLLTGRDEEGP